MSDNNVCPKCGKPSTVSLGTYFVNDFCQCYTITDVVSELQAEIARLKAALEQDGKEILVERRRAQNAIAAIEKAERERDEVLAGGKIRLIQHYIGERDEARRWALYYQKLAQKWKDKYEDTKKGDSRGYEVAEALK